MELRHRILQFDNSPRHALLRSELQRHGIIYELLEHGSIEHIFSEHASYAEDLINFAGANDIWVQSALHYEEAEILGAEWAVAEVGEFQCPQPEDDYIEVTYNTDDYCRRCGQGKQQDQPFRLKQDFSQKQAMFFGLHWVFDEIFVRPGVRRLFDSAGISGVNYREVIHHGSNQPFDEIYQLDIPTVAEPALVVDDLFSVTCKPQNEEGFGISDPVFGSRPGEPFCGRVKYHYPRTKPLIFRASALEGLPDFAKSYECYGSGAAANRFILVRNKVIRLVKEKQIKGISFPRPIHLV